MVEVDGRRHSVGSPVGGAIVKAEAAQRASALSTGRGGQEGLVGLLRLRHAGHLLGVDHPQAAVTTFDDHMLVMLRLRHKRLSSEAEGLP